MALALLLLMALSACALPELNPPTVTPTASDTPVPSATALAATATPWLSPTNTASASPSPSATSTATASPTATATATRFAIVSSARRINIRRGPGTNFPVTVLLSPGSGAEVIGQNEDGSWYQLRLENGAVGWASAELLELQGPPLAPASADAPVLSGETRVVVELAQQPAPADADGADDGILLVQVPIVDIKVLGATATAIVGATATSAAGGRPSPVPAAPASATPTAALPAATPRFDVDVFAFCDDPAFGIAPPRDLVAGSTIKIFWAWFASSDAYLRQHMSNATHQLRVNSREIGNVNAYRGQPGQSGADRVVYWYVPFGPLSAGEYRISYRVTWRSAISDGYRQYGPGTGTEFEEESCSFTVR